MAKRSALPLMVPKLVMECQKCNCFRLSVNSMFCYSIWVRRIVIFGIIVTSLCQIYYKYFTCMIYYVPLGDSVYRASYIPLTPDPLLMTVSWNGRQLKGCPLQINVTSAADASRVVCSGDGLKQGIVGQEIRSFIDTRRAGPGTEYRIYV